MIWRWIMANCVWDEKTKLGQYLRYQSGDELSSHFHKEICRVSQATHWNSHRRMCLLPFRGRIENSWPSIHWRIGNVKPLPSTPKIGALFFMRTVVSGVAVAACLNQLANDDIIVDENGTGERPVAFCSQKLTPTQCAWSVIEREAYAVIFALKKFHYSFLELPS